MATGIAVTDGIRIDASKMNLKLETVDIVDIVALAVTTAKIADLNVTTAKIADLNVTTAKIADAAITQAQVKVKGVVALADAAATLTAAQMINSGIFTITPTLARILTTDTAANIVAALPRYQVGTWFDFTIINHAAFDVTLALGTGVVLTGGTVIHAGSSTWKARIDSATAITIYNTALFATTTGTGATVRATSPVFVTPALGTPSSGILTNATGLPTTGLVDLAVTTAKIADAAVTTLKITDLNVTTAKLADAAVTPAIMKTRGVVTLADIDATLTAAQLIDSGIFTITPTIARTLTTDTAVNIIAGLPRYQIGTWFNFTVICNAAFVVTLAGGVGVTIVGISTVNAVSGTWMARVDSATTITLYRT